MVARTAAGKDPPEERAVREPAGQAAAVGRRRQLLRRHAPFRHLGQFQHEIHHLLLEDGGAEVLGRLRVLAEELHHLLLLARVAPGLLRASRAPAPRRRRLMLLVRPISDSSRPSRMRRSAMAAVLGAAASPRPCPCRPRRAGRPSCRPRPAARSGRTRPPPCPAAPGSPPARPGVEQRALHPHARHRVVFALQVSAHRVPQLRQRPRSRGSLGKGVVHRGQDRTLQRLARHLEARRLAGQLRRPVLGREGHVDGTGLARPACRRAAR